MPAGYALPGRSDCTSPGWSHYAPRSPHWRTHPHRPRRSGSTTRCSSSPGRAPGCDAVSAWKRRSPLLSAPPAGTCSSRHNCMHRPLGILTVRVSSPFRYGHRRPRSPSCSRWLLALTLQQEQVLAVIALKGWTTTLSINLACVELPLISCELAQGARRPTIVSVQKLVRGLVAFVGGIAVAGVFAVAGAQI